MQLRSTPLFRATIFYVLGCISYLKLNLFIENQETLPSYFFLSSIPLLVTTVILIFRFNRNIWWGICISAVFFTFGLGNTAFSSRSSLMGLSKISSQTDKTSWIIRIEERIAVKNNHTKYLVSLFEKDKHDLFSIHEQVKFFLNHRDSMLYMPGAEILISSRPVFFEEPKNPYEFDRKSYYQKKGLVGSFYTGNDEFIYLGNSLDYTTLVQSIRIQIENSVDEHFSANSGAIVKALTVGNRKNIDYTILDQFKKAGIIHVLAISGLHVGILFWIMQFLLTPIKRIQYGQILFQVFIIAGLWIFAFISGFSPSVVRATIMVSLITMAPKDKFRSKQLLNILAATALVVLLFDPLSINDVGFILSFSAVLGIGLFQPVFSKFYSSRSGIVKYIFDIFSVSLSAQIGILPVSLYFFGSFSWIGLFANLLVIPLMGMIIMPAIVLFLASLPFPGLSGFIANIIEYALEFLKQIAFISSNISFGYLENFYISNFSVLLLIALIILVAIYSRRRTMSAFLGICVALISIILSNEFSNRKSSDQDSITFYSLYNQDAIALKTADEVQLWVSDTSSWKFQSYRIQKDLSTLTHKRMLNNGILALPYMYVSNGEKSMLIIKESGDDLPTDFLLPDVDIIYFAEARMRTIRTIITKNSSEMIIAGPNLAASAVNEIAKIAKDQNLRFHDLKEGYLRL